MLTFILAAAVLLHGLSDAQAQPNPEAPNHQQPPTTAGRRRDRPQPGFQSGRVQPMLERVLTEEQRRSLHTAMKSQCDQMRNLERKIRAPRQGLMKASLAVKFDEDAVRAKALEVGKLEAELTVLRAQAMSMIQPPLSEEQVERITNPSRREMDGPPDGSRPSQRRNNRPPPGSRDQPDLPVPAKPESQ